MNESKFKDMVPGLYKFFSDNQLRISFTAISTNPESISIPNYELTSGFVEL